MRWIVALLAIVVVILAIQVALPSDMDLCVQQYAEWFDVAECVDQNKSVNH